MVPFAHSGTLLPLLFPMSLFGRDSHTHTHFSRLGSEVSERPDLPKGSNDFSLHLPGPRSRPRARPQ